MTDEQTGYAETVETVVLFPGYHYTRVNDEGDWTDIDASPTQFRNIIETIGRRLDGEETAGDIMRDHFDSVADEDPADLDEWGTPLADLLDEAWEDETERFQTVQCSHCGYTFEAVDTTGVNSVAFLCGDCGETFDPEDPYEG